MKILKRIKRKFKKIYKGILVLIAIISAIYGYHASLFPHESDSYYFREGPKAVLDVGKNAQDIASIPAYQGEPYITVNGNEPYFEAGDITSDSFEYYPQLDGLGRCGPCMACIGTELMPTEKRGSIGMVKPSGWHTVRYDDLVDGKYLYNRCHLIGFQLAGENANKLNLITGTRYLNNEGMLPFENLVADYVKNTNNHVIYRVTPIFQGNNLVANGVLMEAKSVEDGGVGLKFNVYCYNVQPGVVINYQNGESYRN